MRNATVVAALFALVVFGCDGTAVNPDDQAQDQVEVDGKADGSSAAVARPLGTYRVAHQYAGRLTMVTFKSDKTFHYEMMVYCAGGGTCPPVGHDGTYTFSKSGTTRYIRFLDAEIFCQISFRKPDVHFVIMFTGHSVLHCKNLVAEKRWNFYLGAEI